MKPILRLLVLLAVLPLLSACKESEEAGGLPTPPIMLPINMKNIGSKAEIILRVSKCNLYGFSLRFGYKENDQLDRARVRKLVGGYEIDRATGKPREPGIPTLVRLEVSEISGKSEKLLFHTEIDPVLTSWGADNFGKQIEDKYLQPGIYHVVLETLSDPSEYIGTPVSLVIASYPKERPSKQICPN
jgi:hypothetical protein